MSLRILFSQFMVCNHVTGRPFWRSIQQNFFWKNFHENTVQFPEERNDFVLDHHRGRRDVTCKPTIEAIGQSCDTQEVSLSVSMQSIRCEEKLSIVNQLFIYGCQRCIFVPFFLLIFCFQGTVFFLDFDIATLKPKKQSCLVVWRLNSAAQAQYACKREHKCK